MSGAFTHVMQPSVTIILNQDVTLGGELDREF